MYAPDTSYSDVRIDLFYENLEDRDNIIPRKYKKMNLGNFSVKVGCNAYTNWQNVHGRFTTGSINKSGEKLLHFYVMNKLCSSNTLYKYKHHKLVIWTTPVGRAQNQIDFIIIQQSCKSTLVKSKSSLKLSR